VASQVRDPMSGFFALRREVIAGCDLQPTGYKILLEVLGVGRYRRLAEVGYVFLEREAGASKVTARQYLEYLQHIVRLGARTGELYRFLKFGLVGASGVLVNLAALWCAREILGLPLWVAAAVAVEAAILSNFVLNDQWTFRDPRRDRGRAPWPVRLLRFNAICTLGAVINVGVLLLLSQVLGWYYLFAQLVGIGASTLWNYTLNAAWNWRTRSHSHGVDPAAQPILPFDR
jgi:dolichol-phosphate mannosyltransferase